MDIIQVNQCEQVLFNARVLIVICSANLVIPCTHVCSEVEGLLCVSACLFVDMKISTLSEVAQLSIETLANFVYM